MADRATLRLQAVGVLGRAAMAAVDAAAAEPRASIVAVEGDAGHVLRMAARDLHPC